MTLREQYDRLETRHRKTMKDYLYDLTDRNGIKIVTMINCDYKHRTVSMEGVEYLTVTYKLHGHGSMEKREGGDTGARCASEPPAVAENTDSHHIDDPTS